MVRLGMNSDRSIVLMGFPITDSSISTTSGSACVCGSPPVQAVIQKPSLPPARVVPEPDAVVAGRSSLSGSPIAVNANAKLQESEPQAGIQDAVKVALMVATPDDERSHMFVGCKVFALKQQLAGEIARCDNGASISCSTTSEGRLPGTLHVGCLDDAGPLTIGDTSSSLGSEGTYWHAMELRSDNGKKEDTLQHMHFCTPTSIANILSESQECQKRGSRIEEIPGFPRMWHTGKGTKLALRMGGNGLGFLRMIPITDQRRIQRLLDENPVVRRMVEASSEYQQKLLIPVMISIV